MKFLIIADLHGRMPKIHFKEFDAIIAPGDFNSDEFHRPYVKKWFQALKKDSKNTPGLGKFFVDHLGEEKLEELDEKSLEVGRKILEFLNSFNVPVFIVPGNWDQSYGPSKIKDPDKSLYNNRKAFIDWWHGDKTNPFLTKNLKNIYDCPFHLFQFPEFNIIGYGLSSAPENPKAKYKFDHKKITSEEIKKLEKAYSSLKRKIYEVCKRVNTGNPTIFLTHNIPYKTLDIVLDEKSYAYKKHLGSTLAREFIEEFQPLVCIGGHIHDHFGQDKIGKTTVINAGFGPEKNTLLEIENGKIKRLEFYPKDKVTD